jgi:catechol 2,3-dioxygenase-like lactoylglutathione lyase family enzyme
MNLNHLNLTVPNVAAARSFFERHFNFKCVDVKGDNMLVVLNDDNGFIFTLMSETFNKNGLCNYPQNFHFGFILDSKEEVSNLYEQLKGQGVHLENEPGKIRNSFGFYFYFDNLFIEIGHYMTE